MKTTLLIDPESLIIKDAHFTTKKAYDGHIGFQVFRRRVVSTTFQRSFTR